MEAHELLLERFANSAIEAARSLGVQCTRASSKLGTVRLAACYAGAEDTLTADLFYLMRSDVEALGRQSGTALAGEVLRRAGRY